MESQIPFTQFLAQLSQLRRLQVIGHSDLFGRDLRETCNFLQRYFRELRNIVYQVDPEDSARADHGVRINYDIGDPESFTAPGVSVHLDIDRNGKTSAQMAWRVKVLPKRWCTVCGVFKENAFFGCGLDHNE